MTTPTPDQTITTSTVRPPDPLVAFLTEFGDWGKFPCMYFATHEQWESHADRCRECGETKARWKHQREIAERQRRAQALAERVAACPGARWAA